jgi:tetratricopeptide (TPR) repeat protein
LKAIAYRQLGWLYYYSENLSKLNKYEQEKHLSLCSPLNAELALKSLNSSSTPPLINRQTLQLTLEYLTKSAQLDPNQNLTWYYLGRAFACKGDSREAFIAYKNSVSTPEATGHTWCSIGVLYHQQHQFMDALQAFVCAIQLEHRHYAAWLNLGILYEQDNQFEEALKCYKLAVKSKLIDKTKRIKLSHQNVDKKENGFVEL